MRICGCALPVDEWEDRHQQVNRWIPFEGLDLLGQGNLKERESSLAPLELLFVFFCSSVSKVPTRNRGGGLLKSTSKFDGFRGGIKRTRCLRQRHSRKVRIEILFRFSCFVAAFLLLFVKCTDGGVEVDRFKVSPGFAHAQNSSPGGKVSEKLF